MGRNASAGGRADMAVVPRVLNGSELEGRLRVSASPPPRKTEQLHHFTCGARASREHASTHCMLGRRSGVAVSRKRARTTDGVEHWNRRVCPAVCAELSPQDHQLSFCELRSTAHLQHAKRDD
eukprot:2749091-Rhodomonas_salina.3